MSEYGFGDNNTSLAYNRTEYELSQKENSLYGG